VHAATLQVRLAVSDDAESGSDGDDSELDAAAYDLSDSDASSSGGDDGSGGEDDEDDTEEEDVEAGLEAAIQGGGRIGRRESRGRAAHA